MIKTKWFPILSYQPVTPTSTCSIRTSSFLLTLLRRVKACWVFTLTEDHISSWSAAIWMSLVKYPCRHLKYKMRIWGVSQVENQWTVSVNIWQKAKRMSDNKWQRSTQEEKFSLQLCWIEGRVKDDPAVTAVVPVRRQDRVSESLC